MKPKTYFHICQVLIRTTLKPSLNHTYMFLAMKPKKSSINFKRFNLPWFFFIVCCGALSYSSTASPSISEAASHKILCKETQSKNGYKKIITKSSNHRDEYSRRLYTGKGIHEVVHLRNDGKERKEKAMVIPQMKKANKGVYGGGDQYRPKKKNGAASSMLPKSSSFLSMTVLRTLAVGFLLYVLF